jgi:hypothetical protein
VRIKSIWQRRGRSFFPLLSATSVSTGRRRRKSRAAESRGELRTWCFVDCVPELKGKPAIYSFHLCFVVQPETEHCQLGLRVRRIHAQKFVFSLAFLRASRRWQASLWKLCVSTASAGHSFRERERGGQMHHTADRDLGVSRADQHTRFFGGFFRSH